MRQGLSRLKLLVIIFVVTLTSFIGLLGLYLYSTNQSKVKLPFLTPPVSEVVSEAGVTFRSEIPGLKIESLDNEQLKTYLA